MVYVTGDLHGDIRRFGKFRRLRRGDTLLVCGDFGFLWTGDAAEQRVLKRLGRRPYTILFVDGVHENHALLDALPVTQFAGAAVHQLGRRLYHVLRGEILELEGRSFFVCGGGESPDADLLEEGKNWWSRELPSQQELAAARARLLAHDNRVDYVVTHQPPQMIYNFLQMHLSQFNPLSAFLDEVSRSVRFDRWFFGALHLDKVVSSAYVALFKELRPAWKKGERAPKKLEV